MSEKRYNYPPKEDCEHCNGSGMRKNKTGEHTCFCRYIDHNDSDKIGSMLGAFAKRELKKLRGG